MAVCLNCGAENPAEFGFCGACGAPLATQPAHAHGGRKIATILFCDLVGSTALAERVDAESLREVMERYFTLMRSILESHGGIVEKFVGDAVMAIFGLPRAHEDDPLRAVRAADQMRENTKDLNSDLEQRWGVTLANRTGINTGEVVVGDPGSGQRLALGDAINVAARLEQAAGANEVLLGETTHQLVKGAVEVEEIEPLALKGKTDPVQAFKLISLEPHGGGPREVIDAPIVGREEEVALLEAAFECGISRTACQFVTVTGEAGIGKSRLVRALLHRLTGRARVLQGRCLSYGEGITFWPLIQVVKQAAAIADDDHREEALAKLSSLLPGTEAESVRDRLSALVGLTPATFPLEESFWAAKKAFEGLARWQPLAIVFEDVHWGDPAFLDFLGALSESQAASGMLVICTARSELLDDHPEWMRGRSNATAIELDVLSTTQSEILIDGLGVASRLSPQERATIIRTGRGNPLFVEQICSMLVAESYPQPEIAPISLNGNAIPIPSTLTGLLSARLDRLADDDREVLGAAAVVGELFYRGAVEELCSQNLRPVVGTCLESLINKKLIRPDPSSFVDEEAFAFQHLLIRDAAYQGILKGKRVELHQHFAEWLERKVSDRVAEFEEILGFHLEQAYVLQRELTPEDAQTRALGRRAARLLASAGHRARSRGDNRATVVLLGRAVKLFGEGDGGLELLPDLGKALWDTGNTSDARSVFERAIEEATARDNRLVAARAVIARSIMITTGLSDVRAEVKATIPVLSELGDEIGLARAWNALGVLSFWEGHFEESEDALQRSIAHGRAAGDRAEVNNSLIMLSASTVTGPTPVDQALERLRDLLGEAPGEMALEAFLVGAIAQLLADKGEFEEARKASFRSRAMLEDLGSSIFAAAMSQEDGYIEMLAEDPLQAETELRSGYVALGEMGEVGFRSTIAIMLAHALCAQGRWDEAIQITDAAEAEAGDDDVVVQIGARGARAKFLSHQGLHEQAERLMRDAVKMAADTSYVVSHGEALLDLGEILRLGNKHEEASLIFRQALDLFEKKGHVVYARRARAALDALTA